MTDVKKMNRAGLACLWVWVCMVCILGCHSDIGVETREFSCQSSQDCLPGWSCDPAAEICVQHTGLEDAGPSDAESSDTGPSDADPPDADVFDATGDTDATAADASQGCSTNDECSGGEQCDPRTSQCVSSSVCIDASGCEQHQFCDLDNQCQWEVCDRQGDRCDASIYVHTPQGPAGPRFFCVPDSLNAPLGTCATECYADLAPSVCPEDTFCTTVDPINGQLGCVPSQCDNSGGCTEPAQCIEVEDSLGRCLPVDPNAEPGRTCQSLTESACISGTLCVASQCQQSCSPWGSTNSPCDTNEKCVAITAYTGVCLVPLSTGKPFDSCDSANQGRACSSEALPDTCEYGVASLGASPGFACFPQCRLGKGDCDTISASNGGGTVCNTFMRPGQSTLGVCTPECASNADCGGTLECKSGLCRVPCTTNSGCSQLPVASDSDKWICQEGICQ